MYYHSVRGVQFYDILGMMLFIIMHCLFIYIDFGKAHDNIAYIATMFLQVEVQRVIIVGIWGALWLQSVTMWFRFAECDFSKAPAPSGRFGVGGKSIFSKDGNHLLVFYPIEKADYNYEIKKEENRMPWRVFGDRHKKGNVVYETTMMGFSAGENHLYDKLTVAAINNAKYDIDEKKLVPYIFNHGFGSSSSEYTARLIEMASHGYLVIGMSDNEGSTNYTERPDGSAV